MFPEESARISHRGTKRGRADGGIGKANASRGAQGEPETDEEPPLHRLGDNHTSSIVRPPQPHLQTVQPVPGQKPRVLEIPDHDTRSYPLFLSEPADVRCAVHSGGNEPSLGGTGHQKIRRPLDGLRRDAVGLPGDALGRPPGPSCPSRPEYRHRVAPRPPRPVCRRGGHAARDRPRAENTASAGRRAAPHTPRPRWGPPPSSQHDESPSRTPTQDGV